MICSVEEERLFRQKNSLGLLPINAIKKCLETANINLNDVDLISLPGETYNDLKLRTENWIKHYWGYCPKITLVNHQIAHIASSFFHSGFERAMCLTMDAFGDRLSAALVLADKEKEILNYIYKAGFQVEENTPLCLLSKKFFGFLKKEKKTVEVCRILNAK